MEEDRQIQDKADKNKVQPTGIIYVGNTSPTNLDCLEGQHPITRQAFLMYLKNVFWKSMKKLKVHISHFERQFGSFLQN